MNDDSLWLPVIYGSYIYEYMLERSDGTYKMGPFPDLHCHKNILKNSEVNQAPI